MKFTKQKYTKLFGKNSKKNNLVVIRELNIGLIEDSKSLQEVVVVCKKKKKSNIWSKTNYCFTNFLVTDDCSEVKVTKYIPEAKLDTSIEF